MSTWAEWIVESNPHLTFLCHSMNPSPINCSGKMSIICANQIVAGKGRTQYAFSLKTILSHFHRWSQEPVRKSISGKLVSDQVADEMVWKQDLTMRYRRGGNWQWDIMVVGGTGMTTRMWRLRNSNFRPEFHSQTELWKGILLICSFFVEKIQKYLFCRLSRKSF